MTKLVELSVGDYSKTAFAAFDGSANTLTIDNARAMMWAAQLAYEAYDPTTQATISTVAKTLWGFSSITPFMKDMTSLTTSFDTGGIFGERADAVVLAFGGTDPALWRNVSTDGNFLLDPHTDVHIGIEKALNGVTGKDAPVDQAISLSQQTKKPLWITGHSLGGSLAVLAAQYAANKVAAKAVYTFGMPRTGGATFQAAYNAQLGPVTCRFVYASDIVPRIFVDQAGYRHVGHLVQCGRGEKFDPATLSPACSDEPSTAADLQALGSNVLDLAALPAQILQAAAQSVVSKGLAGTLVDFLRNPLAAGANPVIQKVLGAPVLSPPGPGQFGQLFVFLPPPVRDHLQDRYWTALTP